LAAIRDSAEVPAMKKLWRWDARSWLVLTLDLAAVTPAAALIVVKEEFMSRRIELLLVAFLAASTLWAADDPFVGKWKLNPSRSKLTDVMKVQSVGAKRYAFNFGGGPETIVLDGTDQPGGFGTTLSVVVEGPGNWKVVRKRNSRTLLIAIWNLSKDGSTLTDNFTGINPNESTYNLNYVYKRKGGGSGFAGEWVSTTETVNSVVMLEVRP
jgi:hypothetical protein